jgi:hypothetical protein
VLGDQTDQSLCHRQDAIPPLRIAIRSGRLIKVVFRQNNQSMERF